jgi:threonine aldolase
MINRDLTQQEWDLLRAIRVYREIRNSEDEVVKERVRQEAEDALMALMPSENIKKWIKEKRDERAEKSGIVLMTQEEFDESAEIGEVIEIEQGEKLKCIGKENGVPLWEVVK